MIAVVSNEVISFLLPSSFMKKKRLSRLLLGWSHILKSASFLTWCMARVRVADHGRVVNHLHVLRGGHHVIDMLHVCWPVQDAHLSRGQAERNWTGVGIRDRPWLVDTFCRLRHLSHRAVWERWCCHRGWARCKHLRGRRRVLRCSVTHFFMWKTALSVCREGLFCFHDVYLPAQSTSCSLDFMKHHENNMR